MGTDGLFIVDKPGGITSLDVVKEVKHRFRVKKAGHIGTLDPFATGVLPVVINEGTKLVPFLEEEPKEYEGTVRLGEETRTDDLTGEVVSRGPWEDITPQTIQEAFRAFWGRIYQIPPMFSAIKIGGKPLYRLARKGIEIERKEREVKIFQLQVDEIRLPYVGFRVSCSKGTYVRTLAKDIGRKIGCGAHLSRLRRIRSGSFTIERAIPWRRLKDLADLQGLQPWLISLEEALPALPELVGDERLVKKVRFGNEMAARDLSFQNLPAFEKGQWIKITSPQEGLVAILQTEVKGSDIERVNPEMIALRPLRVFNRNKQLNREGYT